MLTGAELAIGADGARHVRLLSLAGKGDRDRGGRFLDCGVPFPPSRDCETVSEPRSMGLAHLCRGVSVAECFVVFEMYKL